MIKRINHIKNFGVFKNYRRNGEIQDFAKVNIIYGWNYSGKTTISRLFQNFELKRNNENYLDADYEIEDFDSNKGNQENLNINNLNIKVFNSDFIRDNIHLEGENFNPVLLLGEDTKKAQEELTKESEKLEKAQRIIKNLNKEYLNIENSILGGLTNTASKIKETLQIVQAYTRTHLKPTFDKVKNDHNSFILAQSEVNELLKIATNSEENKLPILDEFNVELLLENKFEEVKNLLDTLPEFSKTIKHFIENPEIANWVEQGLPLHQEKSNCEFCGNDVSNERLIELSAHFSTDLKNHKNQLTQLAQSLNDSKISNSEIQKLEIYKPLRALFKQKDTKLKKSIITYNKQFTKLFQLVNRKKNSPFEKIKDFSKITADTTSLIQSINDYNQVIKTNNQKTIDFDKAKTNAITKLKEHYTAKFIQKIKLADKESKAELYKNREIFFISHQKELSKSVATLEARISQAHKGKEKLNEYIQKFLGRDEIKVVVTKEGEKERFRLKRNDVKAVNLSEGEKTAIAFSFFLTKLLECKNLDKTIIYIDDPISSLDSNHIFQVNALLKDFFFKKEEPENDYSPTLLNCLQLFLSTHNFDFFGLLRELPKPKESNKFYYYVRRKNEVESEFEKLPKSIEYYSSEYHYLFELIYNFDNSEVKDYQELMGIPNAVRRFVELYTYSRVPGNHNSSTVDKRAEKIWGTEKSKRVLKVFHYFSHSNNIERMMKNSDLMCDIENAVTDLHNLIKLDEMHYSELVKTLKK